MSLIPSPEPSFPRNTTSNVLQSLQAEADFEWPAPDVTQDEWQQFVAHGLRMELTDPREDIYSGTLDPEVSETN